MWWRGRSWPCSVRPAAARPRPCAWSQACPRRNPARSPWAGQILDGPGIHVPAERRNVGMVFQDYALFPHLTVEGKHPFRAGWQKRRLDGPRPRHDGADPVDSPGQPPARRTVGRRAAAHRAGPVPGAPIRTCCCWDEPFSSLDAALRKDLRREVRRILQDTGVTTILVTHDQDEALSMCDRLALILEGEVQQVGTPQELYWSPPQREGGPVYRRRQPAAGHGGRIAGRRQRVGPPPGPGDAQRVRAGHAAARIDPGVLPGG